MMHTDSRLSGVTCLHANLAKFPGAALQPSSPLLLPIPSSSALPFRPVLTAPTCQKQEERKGLTA